MDGQRPEATVVCGRWVFADATMPAFVDGAVAINDGVVVAVGPRAEVLSQVNAVETIGSNDVAVLPGFINAHHHAHAITYTQHGVPEGSLEAYLAGLSAVRQGDRELDALLSGARLLAGGITTAVDLFTGSGTADAFVRDVRALRRGYGRAGLRAAVAAGIATHGALVYGAGEDTRFIAGLPVELAARAGAFLDPPGTLSEDDYFAAMGALSDDAADPLRSWLWYAFPGPEWVEDRFIARIAAAAADADTNIQTHAGESLASRIHVLEAGHRGAASHLDGLGVLGPRFSMAHGVWLTADDIALLAERGAGVVHNAGSNLRLGAGIAPVNAMRVAGIAVALGLDGTTLNDDDDMFAEMRLALRLQHEPLSPTATAATPADLFAMATVNGARILRQQDRLGRLLPGHAADLMLVDLKRIVWPWVAPEADPLHLVLLRAMARDVDTVMVGGEIVYRDGAPTRFDLAAAATELAERVAAAAFPAERAEAALALRPHLLAWYGGRGMPAAEPWTAYHSR